MKKRFLKLALICVLIGSFFYLRSNHPELLNPGELFSILKEKQELFREYYATNAIVVIALFSAIYVASTALSLPGAAILTLAAGAIFGFWVALLIVSFASSIGATLAFLVSRFILQDSIESRFRSKLKTINKKIDEEGAFYLFALRLVPAFPFFVINLVMGLTRMKVFTFYWVSQVGMFAGTIVFVNAGTQIAKLESPAGILSPGLIGSFVLLAMFPLIAKKLLESIKKKQAYRGWRKPKSFDYNLVVIGAGSAGLVSSYIAAAVKAKVALIEKDKMGGDCLNTGCVPSKAMIKTAKILSLAKKAENYGLKSISIEFDFAEVMDRVQRVIKEIEPHDSVERYTNLGVECIQGAAEIVSPWQVKVGDRVLNTRNIIVASGAYPFVPPIPGLDQVSYLTSDNVWNLRKRPERLLVLGGGPIGSELTQAFARLGSKVTQVEMHDSIMGREDPEVSEYIKERFFHEGIDVLTSHRAVRVEPGSGGQGGVLICEHGSEEVRVEFDEILVALGRRARVKGFGLENLGVRLSESGTIATDEYLRTNIPNVFVCGDAVGPYQFTHTAAHTAWFAAVNALFGRFKQFKVDYRVVPWATFTDPEVARVGLNETEAKEQGVEVDVTTYGIDDLDRAIADGAAHGWVKVLTAKGSDQVLGATIVGEHAGDLIIEYIAAMKHGFGLNKILGTIHIYPTLAEANKFAAGNWKRSTVKQWQMNFLSRLHAWTR